MSRIITVLVVDDSGFMRKILTRMLNSDPNINVIGDAEDGMQALEKIRELRPDVVTLDVNMPKMNGLETLERIMKEFPLPVVMISSMTCEGGEVTLAALKMGAVDFIDKSTCHTSIDMLDIAEVLVQKIKIAAGVDPLKIVETVRKPSFPHEYEPIHNAPAASAKVEKRPEYLVAIGASTGGPISLEKIFVALPKEYHGSILVVQHIPVGFTKSLAERMNRQCLIHVKEAEEGDLLVPGTIYIAPGGCQMTIGSSKEGTHIILSKDDHSTPHCPSVDVMMKSVAQNWHGRMMGIVMTGMGNDGSEGVRAMKDRGATIIAQSEETCVVFGMPKAAQLTGCVNRMVPLEKIAGEICRFR